MSDFSPILVLQIKICIKPDRHGMHRKLAFGTEIFYSNSTYFSDYYDQQNYGFAVSLRKPIGERCV